MKCNPTGIRERRKNSKGMKQEVQPLARIPPKSGGKFSILQNSYEAVLVSKGLGRKSSYKNLILQNSYENPLIQRGNIRPVLFPQKKLIPPF